MSSELSSHTETSSSSHRQCRIVSSSITAFSCSGPDSEPQFAGHSEAPPFHCIVLHRARFVIAFMLVMTRYLGSHGFPNGDSLGHGSPKVLNGLPLATTRLVARPLLVPMCRLPAELRPLPWYRKLAFALSFLPTLVFRRFDRREREEDLKFHEYLE